MNNLVLLQAIERFNVQPTQNVAMKVKEPTRMNYTEIPVLRKFATCANNDDDERITLFITSSGNETC